MVQKLAANPVTRAILKRASHKGVVSELSKGDTVEQIDRLDSTGELSGGKLKAALMREAPGEMDKAIKRFQKQGKEITVDSLCAEAKSTPGFLQMCNNVGLTIEWFEELARQRMEKHGL